MRHYNYNELVKVPPWWYSNDAPRKD